MTMGMAASERINARPVWKRHLLRQAGFVLGPPSEEEKSDAIRVLHDAPIWEKLDASLSRFGGGSTGFREFTQALVLEAERIHDEASRTL